jgi:hypothetical protein
LPLLLQWSAVNQITFNENGLGVQEDNATVAALQGDPFIDCYRAWLREKQFSSGTGADFLRSFSDTSGMSPSPLSLSLSHHACLPSFLSSYPLAVAAR